jgi:O-acetylhomoserine/O-acetylserine sulfhydrylase-like pyridoxal-dependent enzyme
MNTPLIVDNTFGAAGAIAQPLKYGANIVTASTTKWIRRSWYEYRRHDCGWG